MNQYEMERVEVAKYVISKMWDCNESQFTLMKKRNTNIVIARRFFIYYLWKHCDVKHNRMKDYIHGMNHATSIYHCRKFEEEMKIYKVKMQKERGGERGKGGKGMKKILKRY